MGDIKVFQLNSELHKVTGIQRVIMDIHEALKDEFDAKILGTIPYPKLNKNLDIQKRDYIKFSNPLVLRNSIVIIHERKYLPLMWLLSHIPGLNIKYVYVHHNRLYGNKVLSKFPNEIVAISDAGIDNLTNYFGIERSDITKIHNCVRIPKKLNKKERAFNNDDIRILYPARINDVKQQVEIVKHLTSRLSPNIKIFFAGIGPEYEELKKICSGSNQFVALGFCEDIPNLMLEFDFMLLYSKHEGLPISLIEATMTGTPAICNGVDGSSEIIVDDYNGFIVGDWDDMIVRLNSLSNLATEDYSRLSQQAVKTYKSKFTFEKFKNSYCELIHKIYAETCT